MARPSKPILSRDLIFRSALALLDRNGQLSIPELAQHLGVSVSSLYHHVKGRQEILEGVRGLLTEWDSSDAEGWQGAVSSWAHQYKDAFARHPAAIPALVAQSVSNPATLRQYDALADVLAAQGFSARSIVLSVSMLDVLCLGAAIDQAAPSMVWNQAAEHPSVLRDALSAAQFGRARGEEAFDLQLELIIGGMAALLADDLGT